MASGEWLSGYQLTSLALTLTDIRHHHRHWHHGGMSKKPPPIELQSPVTITTLLLFLD